MDGAAQLSEGLKPYTVTQIPTLREGKRSSQWATVSNNNFCMSAG